MNIHLQKVTTGHVLRFGATDSLNSVDTARDLRFFTDQEALTSPLAKTALAKGQAPASQSGDARSCTFVHEDVYGEAPPDAGPPDHTWDFTQDDQADAARWQEVIAKHLQPPLTWAECFLLQETVDYSDGALRLQVKRPARSAFVYGKYHGSQKLLDFFQRWRFHDLADFVHDLDVLNDLLRSSDKLIGVDRGKQVHLLVDSVNWLDHELIQLIRTQGPGGSASNPARTTHDLSVSDWTVNRRLGLFEPFDHGGRIATAAKLKLYDPPAASTAPAELPLDLREYSNWRAKPTPRFGCLDLTLTQHIELKDLGPEITILPLISEGTIPRGNHLLVPIQCGAVYRAGQLLGHCRDLTLLLDIRQLLGKAILGQLSKPFFRLKGYHPIVFAATVA